MILKLKTDKFVIYNSKRYMLLAYLFLILWAPWSILNTLFFNAYDPPVFRFTVALSAVLFFSLYTKSKKFNSAVAEHILIFYAVIVSIHIVFLSSVNDYRILYVAGTFALQVVFTLMVTTIFHFLLINISMILSVPIFGLYYNIPQEPWTSMFFLLTTIVLAQGITLYQKIKNQNELMDTIQKLNESEKARLQSAKMATLGEIAGGIAHEINNPISIIQGKANLISKLISQQPIETEKIQTSINKIIDTVTRIGKITKGLLLYARDSGSDAFKSTDVVPIIDNTVEMIKEKMFEAKIEIILHIPNSLIIDCKDSQISQLLMNLLNNSYEVLLPLNDDAKKWIEICAVHKEDRFILQVKDSGLGIPENIVEKMMQPFFSTKEINKNTGLGLSISDGIARQHNGSLVYNLDMGHTCFTLNLPMKQDQVEKPTLA